MSRGRFLRKQVEKRSAKERVKELFVKAAGKRKQGAADRLVRKARRLAMKHKVPLRQYKTLFCTHCYARLVPGENCRVRIHKGRIIYSCLTCKKFRRIPLHGRPQPPSKRISEKTKSAASPKGPTPRNARTTERHNAST